MCTLIVATRLRGGPPLWAIHNRDEDLDRRALPPGRWARGDRGVIAPRDLKAGGSWVALNDRGVFAGITNRFQMPSKPEHRSRGELVLLATESESASVARQRIEGLDPLQYNGFHLFVGDAREAYVLWNDGARIHTLTLRPGVYVLTERSFQGGSSHRLRWMEARVRGMPMNFSPKLEEELRAMMRVRLPEDPLEGTCVRLAQRNYGTRCSAWVKVHSPEEREFYFAPDSPCEVAYQDYSTPRAWAF